MAVALTALGFERTSRLGATAWSGRYQGRTCTVSVSRQSRTRYAGDVHYREQLGYRLRIELETHVRTQLFFVKEGFSGNFVVRWVYRLRKQAVVERVPPELQGFTVVTVDAPWAERLLAERGAMVVVAHLLRDGASPKLAGSVYFQPGEVHYGSPILQGEQITADRVQDVIHQLDGIAQAAERIAAPEVVSEPTRIEELAKKHPFMAVFLVLGGCMGTLLVATLLLVAVFAVLHR